MSTKPTNTAGPTTNVKVTAILEKANAIRQVRYCPSFPFPFLYVHSLAMLKHNETHSCETCQAVGSDDGDDDDDTWSDA